MKLLDGKKAREASTFPLVEKIKALSFIPQLVIIQVGNRADSTAFITAKKLFAKRLGVQESHLIFPEDVTEEKLISEVKKYNADKSIHGIIVQLPLPIHINADNVIDTIEQCKDIDGLTSYNMKRWVNGHADAFVPATTRGVRELLDFYKIDLFGKKVTMVGRSSLVGKPTAMMCLNQNATVTICHSKTADLMEETRKADILIVAIGKAHFIDQEYVREGQIVIDIGITRMPDGTLAGDVDFEAVKDTVAMITPVPGGVGQMTVLALFENLIDACYHLK